MRRIPTIALVLLMSFGSLAAAQEATKSSLVGHWPLAGDSQDHSGHGNHGVNHGVDLKSGSFDGRAAHVEVAPSDSLRFGTNDFSFCAWVWTADDPDDNYGDVLDLYDPAQRRGITLGLASSSGGYQGQGDARQVHFGIDNARLGQWQDCGRPSATSNYVSNSLTVYKGKLYAAIFDGKEESDWAHVYRYEGGDRWTDCGRVGTGRTTGVGPLLVHKGDLYAVTGTYDWTRVNSGGYDPGRVYRYQGGQDWEDLGQPSDNRTNNCLVSFRGQIYSGGGPNTWGVFTRNDRGEWVASQLFPRDGAKSCFPHAMSRFNGRLYTAWPGAYSFDGTNWAFVGRTAETPGSLQTHSLHAYQGRLLAGTWPEATVTAYDGVATWEPIGRVGVDGTEVNALVVYNGKLYGGSIPRAEVCRYDGAPEWTSLKRFYSPEGWTPVPPAPYGNPTRAEVAEWSRVTSLTVYDGKLFASTGSCTSSVLDAPPDVRGKVFSLEAGKSATFDDDLGPGWKHLAAIRRGGQLELFVDGRLAARSSTFDPADYDITTDRPLRIGFGQTDYFHGKLRDVRAYNRALSEAEVQAVKRAAAPE
ncbi:MAG: LamG domain-containing protein [Pirellulales bacterium]